MAARAEVFVVLGAFGYTDTHSLMAPGIDWIWVDPEGRNLLRQSTASAGYGQCKAVNIGTTV